MQNEGRGFLPVTGTVVDLTASSSAYIAMQTQHQQKHANDVQSVTVHINNILKECNLDASTLKTTPYADDMNTMHNYAIHLHTHHTHSRIQTQAHARK